jgi:hypothetical protein
VLPANVIAIPRPLSYRAPAPAVPVAVLESDTYGYAYGTGKVRVPRWRALVPRVNGQELRVSRAQCIWLVAVATATKKALWPMGESSHEAIRHHALHCISNNPTPSRHPGIEYNACAL